MVEKLFPKKTYRTFFWICRTTPTVPYFCHCGSPGFSVKPVAQSVSLSRHNPRFFPCLVVMRYKKMLPNRGYWKYLDLLEAQLLFPLWYLDVLLDNFSFSTDVVDFVEKTRSNLCPEASIRCFSKVIASFVEARIRWHWPTAEMTDSTRMMRCNEIGWEKGKNQLNGAGLRNMFGIKKNDKKRLNWLKNCKALQSKGNLVQEFVNQQRATILTMCLNIYATWSYVWGYNAPEH